MMPILRKELRSLLRERRGFLVPVLYAAVQAAVGWLYFSGSFGHGLGRVFLGKTLTGTIAVLQLIAVVVFAPLVGASMIASERERGTWARLISSSASRDGIVLGKLIAGCLYLLLFLSISFPITALSLLFGGLDLPTLAGLFVTQALVASCLVAIGLAVSVGFARTWAASLLALGVVLSLIVALPALSMGARLRMASSFPGSVYANAAAHRSEVLEKIAGAFNPVHGLQLFLGLGNAHRTDWFVHFGAMLLLGGVALGIALIRVRRAAI